MTAPSAEAPAPACPRPGPGPRLVAVEATHPALHLALGAVLRDAGYEAVATRAPGRPVVGLDAAAGDRSYVLVTPGDPVACRRAVRAFVDGRAGAVVAVDGLDRLPGALHALAAGTASIPIEVLRRAARAPELKARQAEVLALVQAGRSTAEIAGRLHVSRATVKREVAALLQAFGCRNRAELVAASYEHGYGRRLLQAV